MEKEKAIATIAVSYTHLNVAYSIVPRINALGRMGSSEQAVRLLSVSYTHLDVYKRQGLGFTGSGEGIAAHAVCLVEK